ncbi:MAG TPA: response regulator [Planctomycetota bacterium]|nr:response regulator [Planctomycetota bacterium]
MPTMMIAVVDDDHRYLVQFARMCQYSVPGATVVGFTTVEDFDRHLDALDQCIIVLDLVLAGDSGLRVLAEVRRRRPTLPVIMISAHVTDEARYAARRLGAAGFEDKPRDADGMRALCNSVARFSRSVDAAGLLSQG